MTIPKEISDLVEEYIEDGLYGSLEFIFKAGRLTFIKKDETIVPRDAFAPREVQREEVQPMRPRQASY